VKRSRDSLRKHVCDIVVGVTAVVQLGAESPLPLLRLYDVVSVGRVQHKSQELQLMERGELGI
jgi:hypothetical protein